MRKNTRGFVSLGAIVAIIAVIALAGGAGWYATQNVRNTSLPISEGTDIATSAAPSDTHATNTQSAGKSAEGQNIATSTSGVVVDSNNLYINGKLVQRNIPAFLGLNPSSLGQALTQYNDGFYYDYHWPFPEDQGTADVYTGLATSTKGLTAFIYKRQESKTENDYEWPSTFATILIFSQTQLVQRLDMDFGSSIDAPDADYDSIYYFDDNYIYIEQDYYSTRPHNTVLYGISRSTKKPFLIGDTGLRSPDHTKVAFTSVPSGVDEIGPCAYGGGIDNQVNVVNLTTTEVRIITSDSSRPHRPVSWSTDSKYLFVAEGLTDPHEPQCTDHFVTFFIHDSQTGTKIVPDDANLKSGYAKACAQYRCTEPDIAYLTKGP